MMKSFWRGSAMTMSASGKSVEDLLPPFLRHDSIAYVKDGSLFVRDRRKLPLEIADVECRTTEEAADAIKAMVTQGGGPLEVALLALLLAERRGEDLAEAVSVLSASRPTNSTMRRTLAAILDDVRNGKDCGSAIQAAFDYYDSLYDSISDIGESLISDGDGILTRCFPEHTFMLSVRKAKENGKRIKVFVPETRPYLQGAKLTEPSLRAMGIECYLITDGMCAHYMAEGMIQKYMTASDLALSDRTVVNKTGTLSDAIAAKYFGIPYYAFSLSIDSGARREDIVLEERDGWGEPGYGASMLYPLFDVIPSGLVTGIVTKEGIL